MYGSLPIRVFIKNTYQILDRFSRFCTTRRKVSHWASTLSPKIAPFPCEIGSPSNIWYVGPIHVINPNGISIGSAVFVWVPNAMLYNACQWGRKTPKIAPYPWNFVTPPEEDRPTAISNMHKNGSDRAFGSGDILADRQTDTHTHTYTHTDTHTDVLITFLRHRSHGRSNNGILIALYMTLLISQISRKFTSIFLTLWKFVSQHALLSSFEFDFD